jgi:hypothetical protein
MTPTEENLTRIKPWDVGWNWIHSRTAEADDELSLTMAHQSEKKIGRAPGRSERWTGSKNENGTGTKLSEQILDRIDGSPERKTSRAELKLAERRRTSRKIRTEQIWAPNQGAVLRAGTKCKENEHGLAPWTWTRSSEDSSKTEIGNGKKIAELERRTSQVARSHAAGESDPARNVKLRTGIQTPVAFCFGVHSEN